MNPLLRIFSILSFSIFFSFQFFHPDSFHLPTFSLKRLVCDSQLFSFKAKFAVFSAKLLAKTSFLVDFFQNRNSKAAYFLTSKKTLFYLSLGRVHTMRFPHAKSSLLFQPFLRHYVTGFPSRADDC